MLKIALDMDGVMADMLDHLLNQLYIDHGEDLHHEDILHWDISRACKRIDSKTVYSYFRKPGFFRNLAVIDGAKGAVASMQAQGFKVMIITAVNHEVGKQDKTAWLAEHFPKIKPENIHFEHEKYKIHADVFVDDNVENLIAYKAAHPKTLVICMDAPYNVNFEGLRAYNWSDVLRWIESATEVREYV